MYEKDYFGMSGPLSRRLAKCDSQWFNPSWYGILHAIGRPGGQQSLISECCFVVKMPSVGATGGSVRNVR